MNVICIDAKWYRVRFEFAYRSLSDIMCNTIKRFHWFVGGDIARNPYLCNSGTG